MTRQSSTSRPRASRREQRRKLEQLSLPRTAGWGGRRKGAGGRRKPGSGVSHRRRRRFTNLPVHVTLRVRRDVWNLRSRRCFRALHRAFVHADARLGLQLCHFSVQGNHLHFLVEAEDARALSRGMQGLTIRMAKALNRVMQRRGAVFADRFHAHLLRTPTEVRHALSYVLGNHAVHAERAGRSLATAATADLYSSAGYLAFEFALAAAIAAPRTWLLRRAVGPPSSPA